jgi:hypothetical protein
MNRRQRLAPRLGILLLLLVAVGCQPPQPPPSSYYNGPIDPIQKVASDINWNSSKIPSIYAMLEYKATLIDKEHDNHPTSISGDGSLLYRRLPASLLLRGKKDLVGEVFAIGSNQSEFWLKVGGDVDTTWWGHYANLGKPGCKSIPIRPDLLMEVLGVSLFDVDFLHEPVPVMTFNNDDDAYVFTWSRREGDHWIAVKEIWYDRATKLPEWVKLFDAGGRVVLRAKLSKPVRLEIPDLPREQWPLVASLYQLKFPDDGSTISFWFTDDYAVSRHGIPRASSFNRPDPDTKQVIQIDKDCGGPTD